jgi:hypothetical protein
MSQLTRPLVAALSLLVLWVLAMVLETLRVPVWVLVVNGALLLVNVIVLTASIHQVMREQGRGDGDGGVRPHRRDVRDSGGGGGISWWPEFERELAQYLAEQQRDDREQQRDDRGRDRVPVGSVDAWAQQPPTLLPARPGG